MRTRVGLEDTVSGMLINNIEECNYTSGLARKMTKEILDYLTDEGILIMPHVCSNVVNKSAQFKQWILSIVNNRWYSVDEKLPENTHDNETLYWIYLVNDKGEKHIDIAYYWADNWTNLDTWEDFDNDVKYYKKAKQPRMPNGC